MGAIFSRWAIIFAAYLLLGDFKKSLVDLTEPTKSKAENFGVEKFLVKAYFLKFSCLNKAATVSGRLRDNQTQDPGSNPV